MATLAINAGETQPDLGDALARLAPGAPITVMVHGFRYCPAGSGTDPHQHILSDSPESDHWKSASWPQRLALRGAQGLTIGFGWSAAGSFWQAYQRAAQAAADLRTLLTRINAQAPDHPVHLIAHSLGARVSLMAADGANNIRRAIMIHPAMFRREAQSLNLEKTEVFSILSRENTAFDLLLRAALPTCGRTLGHAGLANDRWLDLNLSDRFTHDALAGLGYRIDAPRARVCHWSGYLREGVWDLYRALIHQPAETPMQLLRGAVTRPAPTRPRRGLVALQPGRRRRVDHSSSAGVSSII